MLLIALAAACGGAKRVADHHPAFMARTHLQRELAGMRCARRGVNRIIYEIDDTERLVIVCRIEHCATAYRPG